MNYTAESIVSLSAGRAFRDKIGMYLSADRQKAINLGLRELIVNIQDEFEVFKPHNPFCKIELNTATKEITVSDNMRGIPVGVREDGINSLTAAFLVPHSGGKHTEGVYSSSVGINGEGNKVVCHTAEFLEVWVHRNSAIHYQKFTSNEEGATPVTDVKIIGKCTDTGTIIKYKPDSRVYGDIFIDMDELRQMLVELSFFTKGLKIILIVDEQEEIFYSKNGLMDGLKHNKALSKPFTFFYETEDCKVELALQWVSSRGRIRGYANGLYMPDGGRFITQFKSSLTRTFNSLAKTTFNGETIRGCLDGFVSVKVRMGEFSNQAKTALANAEAGTATSAAITATLKEFYRTRKQDFDTVVEVLTKTTKAEAAADKAREAVMNGTKEIEKLQKKKVFASDKLKDAEYLGQDSTLLLVEGDSAAGSIAQARDYTKYGILALRGKVINCLSNSEEKIYNNEEIKLLLSAMNITPGKYNSSKLRYGKIAICTDADSDGYHIGLLVMAALYYFAPQFLYEHRLCWLRSPLYIVNNKGTQSFFFTDEEMDAARGTIKGEISRNKGLGALNADQARISMFTPEFQRLDVLEPTVDALNLLEDLMGKDVEPRADYIYANVDFSKIKE